MWEGMMSNKTILFPVSQWHHEALQPVRQAVVMTVALSGLSGSVINALHHLQAPSTETRTHFSL